MSAVSRAHARAGSAVQAIHLARIHFHPSSCAANVRFCREEVSGRRAFIGICVPSARTGRGQLWPSACRVSALPLVAERDRLVWQPAPVARPASGSESVVAVLMVASLGAQDAGRLGRAGFDGADRDGKAFGDLGVGDAVAQ